MSFHNIPPNGFPDLPDMEEVEAVVKDVTTLKTSVAGLASDVSNLSSSKANQITIAPFFNAETAYEVGDLVYYNGLSYRCTNDHEGEWDADDFAATTVADELATLKSGLTVQTLTPVFNTDAVTNTHVNAYRVGHMVFVDVEYNPVGGTLVTNTAILSLLPPPLSEFWSVYDGYTTLKIDHDGILKYWYPTDSTTLTRRGYSFSYIAA